LAAIKTTSSKEIPITFDLNHRVDYLVF